MSDAPEKIWAKAHGMRTQMGQNGRGRRLVGGWEERSYDGSTAYIRADLHEAAQAEIARLCGAIDKIADMTPHHAGQTANEYHMQQIAREARGQVSDRPMADAEREVMASLVDAWNAFVALNQTHPDHVEDFRRGIHSCQAVLMHRIVQRDYPDWFPNQVGDADD